MMENWSTWEWLTAVGTGALILALFFIGLIFVLGFRAKDKKDEKKTAKDVVLHGADTHTEKSERKRAVPLKEAVVVVASLLLVGVVSYGLYWTYPTWWAYTEDYRDYFFGSPHHTASYDPSRPLPDTQVAVGWQPITISSTPLRFNENGVHVWDMDHPMGCIFIQLAPWAGGTQHGPYCDNGGPDNTVPNGAEWVWSDDGTTFQAMLILNPQ